MVILTFLAISKLINPLKEVKAVSKMKREDLLSFITEKWEAFQKAEAIPINQLRELEKEYVVVLAKPSHFTIAHEIAHAILKHRAFWESNIKQEDEADKLAESWGFKKREN
jgi:hypothetical protein